MNTRAWIPILLVVVLLGACDQGSPESFGTGDAAAVRTALDRWLEANRTDDPAQLAALITEDAVVMLPGMSALEGRDAFLNFLRQLRYRHVEVSATTPEVDGRADLAYVRGTFSQTLVVGDAPQSVTNRGNYLFVARRQADGEWLFSHVIWAPDTR